MSSVESLKFEAHGPVGVVSNPSSVSSSTSEALQLNDSISADQIHVYTPVGLSSLIAALKQQFAAAKLPASQQVKPESNAASSQWPMLPPVNSDNVAKLMKDYARTHARLPTPDHSSSSSSSSSSTTNSSSPQRHQNEHSEHSEAADNNDDSSSSLSLSSLSMSVVPEWSVYMWSDESHYTRNLVYACEDFELMILCWSANQASRIHNHARSHCWMSVLAGVVSEQRYSPAYFETNNSNDNNNNQNESNCEGSAALLRLRSEAERPSPAVDFPTSSSSSSSSSSCPMLLLSRESICAAGDVSYINDSLCLHRVANCAVSNRPVMTAASNAPPPPPPPVIFQRNGNDASRVNESTNGERAAFSLPSGLAVTLHCYAPPIRSVKIFDVAQNIVYMRTPGFYSVFGKRTQHN